LQERCRALLDEVLDRGRGRALAFDEAVAGTHKVRWVFSIVVFPNFSSLFYVAYGFVYLLADIALGCFDLHC
jgi:hypothetical protein